MIFQHNYDQVIPKTREQRSRRGGEQTGKPENGKTPYAVCAYVMFQISISTKTDSQSAIGITLKL